MPSTVRLSPTEKASMARGCLPRAGENRQAHCLFAQQGLRLQQQG
jgi:hypothetical protein